MRTAFILLVLGLCVVLTFGYFKNRKAISTHSGRNRPRLVLLYAPCTVNKDYLEPYQSKIRYTPGLQKFAEQAVVFTNHYTEIGLSGPAYASLFSGNYSYGHGVYYHPASLKSGTYLMSEAFRDNGYKTFYWNGHDYASAKLNYAQGIEPENVVQGAPCDQWKHFTKEDPKLGQIIESLKSQEDYRAFIQVNFTQTHSPYSKFSDLTTVRSFCKTYPEECAGFSEEEWIRYSNLDKKHHAALSFDHSKAVRDLNLGPEDIVKLARVLEITYKSNVHLVDKCFGEILDTIRQNGLLDDSLIAFTTDHGEVLYRKGAAVQWNHGSLEPEVLNIPLIIHIPNRKIPNHFYNLVTRSIDIFPTLAALCGIQILQGETIHGQDFSDALFGKNRLNLQAFSCEGLQHPVTGVLPDPARMAVQIKDGDAVIRLVDGSTVWFSNSTKAIQTTFALSQPLSLPDQQTVLKLQQYRDALIRNFNPFVNASDWKEVEESLRSLGYMN